MISNELKYFERVR